MKILFSLVLTAAAATGIYAATNEVDVIPNIDGHIAKLTSESQKTGSAFETVRKYGNHLIMIAHREGPGSVEWHEHDTDIFLVLDGNATLVTGGKIVGGKTTAPGEIRGTSIQGGQSQKIGKGDIVHINPKTPHQLQVQKGTKFDYFVVKVNQ